MADQEVKEYASSGIQVVAPILEGKVAFTSQTNRCVKQVGRNGAFMVIADIGEERNKNGSGSHAALGQPMGVCTEGDNILQTHAQIGTVKLVTAVTGTVELLDNFGKFYGAFSVHIKNRLVKRHTIEEAYQVVKGVSSYIKSDSF